MTEAFICDAIRTPIGRYGGILAQIRADDLGAVPMAALLDRNPGLDPSAIEEVFYGCANQSGEDNRNVARMSLLLARLPHTVPGVTLNRLCASGLEAVGAAARAIRAGGMNLALAGGVESMTRAPFVIGKADAACAHPRARDPVYRSRHGGRAGGGAGLRKIFFSEEKKQKTFMSLSRVSPATYARTSSCAFDFNRKMGKRTEAR